ncbi:MAG TPA: ADP-forming succinate--CoA ligase subunit beta [Persephonella sp.]|uniref:Succinate--CoA ligase [ADP-forming] subunit beta n=1 Tax=Persephonella marina (strain DSM 14350 / EX-H1) TaxID=123214 RepID=SUCC_PERMH|nr:MULTISPECIES: ADP-forming succinate--CoA ligase subunit beta [Persephonella]C0QQH3.1 RecName: Full=Succinate--CoA ligase [ADP-forming] subunit beta; AltName: Full=Succinyl-CoA synthetase subunit beta; Short=SCS-beta [Persephonella marina EX-H1]ACO03617.1 succinyl-CoA synthetase beta chain (SCS-alpha)(Vegetative protein 63) (VEG63) [Persephonella marina EX-H1]HCB69475.1 ADP-forming succinate--CoA ligase subunit beta [Persephonella sp.]
MKVHEHQAKEIFARYGLPVPKGYPAFTVEEAVEAAQQLGKFPVVVKAQIHAGGRGKAGGVKLANNLDEVQKYAAELLGKTLVTFQTGPEGLPVSRIYIEEGTNIDKEFYVAITLDRSKSKLIIMASSEGGMEIEEVAAKNPEAIITEVIDPFLGLRPYQAREIALKLGLPKNLLNKAAGLFVKLYELYMKEDASMVEINPLVLTKEGNIVILDAKVDFDDNALFRHPDIMEMEDPTQESELEVKAKQYNLNYIKLDGNIACMVNGAGLAMATMDTIKLAGGEPANFLDVGGSANAEQIANAFKIILSDPNVKAIFINIFGGILRCDRLAEGIIQASKEVNPHVPIIVRMEGTNVELGKKMLAESGLDLIPADTMWEGAKKAVELASKA